MASYKPLIVKNKTIQTLSGTDMLSSGSDFPAWAINQLAWTQIRRALCIRAPKNLIQTPQKTFEFGNLDINVHKWWGGVLAPNGVIYGIPYDGTTILKIDPTTDTVTTFGNLIGVTKWCGGVLAPNGMIYGIPYQSTTVLKIDPTTDTVTLLGNLVGNYKWRGGVLAPNGMIYGIPYQSTSVLKIDPTTDTITTFGSLSVDTCKWTGGVLAPNGMIYGIPCYSTSVLKIDPTNDTATIFGSLSGSAVWDFRTGGLPDKMGDNA